MRVQPPSRRRFLQIFAATSALALISASGARMALGVNAPGVKQWRGTAMGADASITLAGLAPGEADAALDAVLAEIERLEKLFSLHDPRSSLSRLNAAGTLLRPARDFLELMALSERIFSLTDGAFDPTVQPLWRLYAQSYGDVNAPRAPSIEEIAARRALIDFGNVTWSAEKISFATPGTAMTLNGIAQGFITDSVTEILRARGLTSVLINLGEYRAIGNHPDKRPWQIGIQDPRTAGEIVDVVALTDQAIATSGAYGARFAPGAAANHLIDPGTGESANRYLSVSVRHISAGIADGLSTAFSCMSEAAIRDATAHFGDCAVLLVHMDGRLTRI